MSEKPTFAFVRCAKIRSIQDLTAMQQHARREDFVGRERVRDDAVSGYGFDWPPELRHDRGYVQAFRDFKKERGAGERKNAPLGLHLLVGVSPSWVEAAGGLHDAKNERNRALMRAAVKWAQEWSGGGVFAARMDLDEAGGAVVDLFVAPVFEQRSKQGKVRPVISTNKALEALAVSNGHRKGQHFAGLNTAWSAYAAAHLDSSIERGKAKAETGREHLQVDEFKRQQDELAERRREVEKREAALAKRQREVEASIVAFDSAVSDLAEGRLVYDPVGRRWNMPAASRAALGPLWRLFEPIAKRIVSMQSELASALTSLRDAVRGRDDVLAITERAARLGVTQKKEPSPGLKVGLGRLRGPGF